MNRIEEIRRINERELELGIKESGSWHAKYKDSAWVYVGGVPYELSEGDIICVMSQVGEVEDLNLVRDKKTGKSRGFAFLKYEDQRSTILAVDNFNGAMINGRKINVDHVAQYRLPKELQEKDDEDGALEKYGGARQRGLPGHAYDGKELANSFDIHQGPNLFAGPAQSGGAGQPSSDEESDGVRKEKRKDRKRKKEKKKEKKKLKHKKKKGEPRSAVSAHYSDEESLMMDDGHEDTDKPIGGRRSNPLSAILRARRETSTDGILDNPESGHRNDKKDISSGGGGGAGSWRGRFEPGQSSSNSHGSFQGSSFRKEGSNSRRDLGGYGGKSRVR